MIVGTGNSSSGINSPNTGFVSTIPTTRPTAPYPYAIKPDSFQNSAPINAPLSDQKIIGKALIELGQIQNDPKDEAYFKQMGIQPIFHNGKDALFLIASKGIRVEFGDMGDSSAHAQWIANQRTIMINQRYRKDVQADLQAHPNMPSPILAAISEAIYHEAGHASLMVKDPKTGEMVNESLINPDPNAIGDDQSSIQEELNCLALNTMAHRYHEKQDALRAKQIPGYTQPSAQSDIVSNGVALYTRLFFDPDPQKQALVNRVILKYGDLPLTSSGHPLPNDPNSLIYRIAREIRRRQALSNASQPSSLNTPESTILNASSTNTPGPVINPFQTTPQAVTAY